MIAKIKPKAPLLQAWPESAELAGLSFEVSTNQTAELSPQYAIGLHAWLLDCIRQDDPSLSQRLHDNPDGKAFAISGLGDRFLPTGQPFTTQPGFAYPWTIATFDRATTQWLRQWVHRHPTNLRLSNIPFSLTNPRLSLPAIAYNDLANETVPDRPQIALSFNAPTSFRHKGNHLPLPIPHNLFHSYLRRWNHFSGHPIDSEPFLTWVEERVVLLRQQTRSLKVAAGKRGSVTGFIGAVELGLTPKGLSEQAFAQYFWQLGRYAPYCGTGHKTPFGLGRTTWGWNPQFSVTDTIPIEASAGASKATTAIAPSPSDPSLQPGLNPGSNIPLEVAAAVQRQQIESLTEQFLAARKRRGGTRAHNVARTWAIVLTWQDLGYSPSEIARDLGLSLETVKTYAKRARKTLETGTLTM